MYSTCGGGRYPQTAGQAAGWPSAAAAPPAAFAAPFQAAGREDAAAGAEADHAAPASALEEWAKRWSRGMNREHIS